MTSTDHAVVRSQALLGPSSSCLLVETASESHKRTQIRRATNGCPGHTPQKAGRACLCLDWNASAPAGFLLAFLADPSALPGLMGSFFFCSFSFLSPMTSRQRYKSKDETKIKIYKQAQSTHLFSRHTYAFLATTFVIAPGKSSSLYRDAQSSVLLTRLIDPSWWKSQTDSLNRSFCVCLVPLSPQGWRRYLHFCREQARDSEAGQGQGEAGHEAAATQVFSQLL